MRNEEISFGELQKAALDAWAHDDDLGIANGWLYVAYQHVQSAAVMGRPSTYELRTAVFETFDEVHEWAGKINYDSSKDYVVTRFVSHTGEQGRA